MGSRRYFESKMGLYKNFASRPIRTLPDNNHDDKYLNNSFRLFRSTPKKDMKNGKGKEKKGGKKEKGGKKKDGGKEEKGDKKTKGNKGKKDKPFNPSPISSRSALTRRYFEGRMGLYV